MRHYVVFGASDEYCTASYKDMNDIENAYYIPGYLPNCPTLVRKIHTLLAVILKLPLRKLWYKQYFPKKYQSGDEYVFVFFHAWRHVFQNGFLEYLRKNYPNSKCVLWLCDVKAAKTFNIEEEKKRFDHVMVFERNFAKEHGIACYPLVYSDYRNDINADEKKIDLLFVGWAKGRYSLLKGIYDSLTEKGVNCQFYLSKIDEEVPQDSGIHIVDWVPYSQYVELLKKAKCILDIVPPNTDCNTLRVNEALSYKCKILTNNTRIALEEFYDQRNISIYSAPEDIKADFLLEPYTNPDYNGHILKMSPKAFVEHLGKVLYTEGE